MADLIFRRACPFPVGYVVMKGNNINPATEYPGTSWTQTCMGRSPMGCGGALVNTDNNRGTVSAGNGYGTSIHLRAGEFDHTLSVTQIPSHTHSFRRPPYAFAERNNTPCDVICINDNQCTNIITDSVGYTGGGGSHNTLHPIETFYFWERTR